MKSGKNLLIFLLLIALIVLSFYKCDDTDIKPDDPQDAPAQIISVNQAKEMYDTYEERRIRLIQEYEAPNPDGSPFDATRYGWYDFETIKNYIAYVEQEAALAKVKVSGMQFYFANYPDSEVFENGTPVKYPRQNSFFLIPTLERNGENYGFITTGNGDKDREPILIKDWISQNHDGRQSSGTDQVNQNTGIMNSKFLWIKPNFYSSANLADERSLILNESNLIPPPKQDTDLDQ